MTVGVEGALLLAIMGKVAVVVWHGITGWSG